MTYNVSSGTLSLYTTTTRLLVEYSTVMHYCIAFECVKALILYGVIFAEDVPH